MNIAEQYAKDQDQVNTIKSKVTSEVLQVKEKLIDALNIISDLPGILDELKAGIPEELESVLYRDLQKKERTEELSDEEADYVYDQAGELRSLLDDMHQWVAASAEFVDEAVVCLEDARTNLENVLKV